MTRRRLGGRAGWLRFLAVLAVLGLIAAGCGGGGGEDGDTAQDPGEDTGEGTGTTSGGGGEEDEEEASGEPTPGGKVVYALEAESTGGFCLYSAQLAISGIMVTQSIYDTLTVPADSGEYVPYLAQSIEPNDTFDSWVITLRDGVTFHNGEPLDAEAVKLNLDTYRGQNPDAFAPLFTFVFQNIDTVEATGPLEVTVTTKTPWPAFPAYLFSSGRIGIMAPEQIADIEGCSRNLIGTGPFQLEEWVPNDRLTATKYTDYWRADEGLPYLDEIEFRPVLDGGQRVDGLETGTWQAMHTSGSQEVLDLREMAENDQAVLEESSEGSEVSYTLLNDAKPPFDDLTARQAAAYAVSEEELNELINDGINTLANGPMSPGSQGYTEDTGYPTYDPDRAKELVQEYKDAHGGEFAFELTWSGTDPTTRQLAEEAAQQLREAGIDVTVKNTADQSQFINDALGGNFQAFIWRNHGGLVGDGLYVWFRSGSPVNFSKFADPEIDRLLDEGRSEIDPERADEIYVELNQRFGEQVWELWGWYTLWGIATAPNVHGILGPELPDGQGMPFPLLAGWHLTSGLWVEQ